MIVRRSWCLCHGREAVMPHWEWGAAWIKAGKEEIKWEAKKRKRRREKRDKKRVYCVKELSYK
jgi:hypothetical protein